MAWILFIILIVAILFLILLLYLSAPVYKGPKSDHFNGKKFKNYGNVKEAGLLDVLKWAINRKRKKPIQNKIEVAQTIPEIKVEKGIKLTMINHTTVLIQFDGINILTDPIWSERASPFQWIGPKRKTIPGVRFNDLPPLDYILLTHNHYDHLDINTLMRLYKKYTPQIITPLGVGAFLRQKGILAVHEMDWWERITLKKCLLHSVPAQHFSGRGAIDRNRTLWCGFVIETEQGNIYFAGDTGYGIHIKKIKERFEKIDLGLLPVGAYKPSWFMSPIHISPFEAVNIHCELQINYSIATHFGTFALADEEWDEPIQDLEQALIQKGYSKDSFITLYNGQSFAFVK